MADWMKCDGTAPLPEIGLCALVLQNGEHRIEKREIMRDYDRDGFRKKGARYEVWTAWDNDYTEHQPPDWWMPLPTPPVQGE